MKRFRKNLSVDSIEEDFQMSTTDLLSGPMPSAIDYNIKNNPSIFDAQGNSLDKINKIRSYLLAIAWNAPQFLNIILDYRNMARSYYNQNPKHFCSTVRFKGVQHVGSNETTVFLPVSGGYLTQDAIYQGINDTTKINLLKVMQQNQLPTQWSNVVYNNGVAKDIAVTNPATLTENEKVLYYYIKHADFFTKMCNLMTRSFQKWSLQIYETWTVNLPADLYPAFQDGSYKVLVTGQFLKAVYSQYLRESKLPNPGYMLPCPRDINPNYIIPIYNWNRTQLTKYINGNSDSYPI